MTTSQHAMRRDDTGSGLEHYEAIATLVRATDYVGTAFLQANELADRLRGDIAEYLALPETTSANLYERTLVESLNEYLDSGLRFESVEQVNEFAKGLTVTETVPWFLRLTQSIWHIRNDPRWVPQADRAKQQGVGVLVSIFNDTKFAELCLKSLRRLAGLPCHIVAVNNSTEGVHSFKEFVLRERLVDEWLDTGYTRHGDGLHRALGRVRRFRYVVAIDSDAIGLKQDWLREMIDRLTSADGGVIGPVRMPGATDLIGSAIHPCCMIADQERIGGRFQIDFRNQWPYWDVGGLLMWDCMLHGIPVVKLSNEYGGPCALSSSLVNVSVRHYWYVSRISVLKDDDQIDGHSVREIRKRLEREYASPDLEGISSARVEPALGPEQRQAGAPTSGLEQDNHGNCAEDVPINNPLDEIAKRCGTDKSSLCHGYTRHYFRHFWPLRDNKLRFLEIGVYKGRSLKMWEEFFPNAEIFAIDNDPQSRRFAGGRTRVFVGDQADEEFLRSFADEVGGQFDIIIDDGGHFMDRQITSLRVLFPRVKPGGMYVIEDLHTSYWESYGGGCGASLTTVEFLKALVDELNGRGDRGGVDVQKAPAFISENERDYLTVHIDSVHFYPSISFISKRAARDSTVPPSPRPGPPAVLKSSAMPRLSVVLTTYNRPRLLERALEGFANQIVPKSQFEVVVVDDGSSPPVETVTEQFKDRLQLKYVCQANSGLAAARNFGLRAVDGDIALFYDDDDVSHPELVAEHLRSHDECADERVAVLGHLDWHPDLDVTPVMHHVTHVGGEYFGFGRMTGGELYDHWKFWGGLTSLKVSLLQKQAGPFDARFGFGYEDTELGCRLDAHGLKVLYNAGAKSYVCEPVTFEGFCRRRYKQGKALYRLAQMHPEKIVPRYHLADAERIYNSEYELFLEDWSSKVLKFEALLQARFQQDSADMDRHLQSLYKVYAQCFQGYCLKGYVEERNAVGAGRVSLQQAVNVQNAPTPQAPSTVSQDAAETRTDNPLHIAFVDTNTPCYDVGSSSLRVFHILKILAKFRHRIDHLYSRHNRSDKQYMSAFDGAVNFIKIQESVNSFRDYLSFNKVDDLDCVWMTNLWSVDYLTFALDLTQWFKQNRPRIKVVIDTMDLHYKKHMRKFGISRDPLDRQMAEQMLALERQLYPIADVVVAVTDVERQNILDHCGSHCNVAVIPNIHEVLERTPPLEQRKNICFLGAFRISHNADAVTWFLREAFSHIVRRVPDVEFHIMGHGNEHFRDQLGSNPHVKVIGYVQDAERSVANYRLFICPMTYGAGMKGKLGVAASAGTPFVTTTIGAEGFEFVDGRDCFITDDPQTFADRCVQLLGDDHTWRTFSANSRRVLTETFGVDVARRTLRRFVEALPMSQAQETVAAPPAQPGDSAHPTTNTDPGRAPKVSIVTACYNCEQHLPECVESIRSQTMQEWEMFLLDDASTDGTRAVIEQYSRMDPRIKAYYYDTNEGPYVRRNHAITRANCDFIVIQDADDIMSHGKLETLYREITGDGRLAMVGSFYREFLDELKGLQYTDCKELPRKHEEIVGNISSWDYAITHMSAIIRRSMFETIGLYDENPFGADAFWFTKLGLYATYTNSITLKNVPEYLTLKRVHSHNQTQLLPCFDPRNKRKHYQAYCEYTLRKVKERIAADPHVDVAAALRGCVCSDFLERFKHDIPRWESGPLDTRLVPDLLADCVWLFNKTQYVSCIAKLNGLEIMVPDIARRFQNLDLLRAMAFLALDMPELSKVCAAREVTSHGGLAGQEFMHDFFEQQLRRDVQNWCAERVGLCGIVMADADGDFSDHSLACAGMGGTAAVLFRGRTI